MRAVELEFKDSWVTLVKNDLYKFVFWTIMLIFMLSLTYFVLKKKKEPFLSYMLEKA